MIRLASTELLFTVTSTRALYGSFESISLAMAELAEAVSRKRAGTTAVDPIETSNLINAEAG
jgi:hypothetical protein